MSERRAVSASPPGPLSTYVERGSALVTLIVGVSLMACRPAAQPVAAPPTGAREFVAEFYAWYQPSSDSIRTHYNVLAQRRDELSPDLAALLDADVACSRASHEVCNLDLDPFLNSQDPCERYEVGGVLPHHDTVGVSVFGVCGGKRDTVPAVIAMVVPHDSGWQFANFIFPAEQADLRTMLTRKPSQ